MDNGVSYTSTKPLEEFEINKKNKPSDLISRLSELRSQYNCFDVSERGAYHTLSEAIKALQEQKTGKWIHREDMDFIDRNKVQHIHLMCENCGLIHDFFDGHTGQYKYCPHCGSRNRGDTDDEI